MKVHMGNYNGHFWSHTSYINSAGDTAKQHTQTQLPQLQNEHLQDEHFPGHNAGYNHPRSNHSPRDLPRMYQGTSQSTTAYLKSFFRDHLFCACYQSRQGLRVVQGCRGPVLQRKHNTSRSTEWIGRLGIRSKVYTLSRH